MKTIIVRYLLLSIVRELIFFVIRSAMLAAAFGLSLLILFTTKSIWLAFIPYVCLVVYLAWDIAKAWRQAQADIREAKRKAKESV